MITPDPTIGPIPAPFTRPEWSAILSAIGFMGGTAVEELDRGDTSARIILDMACVGKEALVRVLGSELVDQLVLEDIREQMVPETPQDPTSLPPQTSGWKS